MGKICVTWFDSCGVFELKNQGTDREIEVYRFYHGKLLAPVSSVEYCSKPEFVKKSILRKFA